MIVKTTQLANKSDHKEQHTPREVETSAMLFQHRINSGAAHSGVIDVLSAPQSNSIAKEILKTFSTPITPPVWMFLYLLNARNNIVHLYIGVHSRSKMQKLVHNFHEDEYEFRQHKIYNIF